MWLGIGGAGFAAMLLAITLGIVWFRFGVRDTTPATTSTELLRQQPEQGSGNSDRQRSTASTEPAPSAEPSVSGRPASRQTDVSTGSKPAPRQQGSVASSHSPAKGSPGNKSTAGDRRNPSPLAKKPPENPGPSRPSPVIERAKQSVALIKGKNGSGSGFVVRPTIVATNSHVINEEYIENLSIQFLSADRPDAPEFKVKLLYEDRRRDLALLLVESTIPKPLPLAQIKELPTGLPIVAIGNPSKLTKKWAIQEINRVSEGTVDSLVSWDRQPFYHLKADIAPGNSGGPVLDARTGDVIGVVTRAFDASGVGGRPLDDLGDPRVPGMPSVYRGVSGPKESPRNAFCIPCRSLHEALGKVDTNGDSERQCKAALAHHHAEMIVWTVDELHRDCHKLAEVQLKWLASSAVYARSGSVDLAKLRTDFAEQQDKILESLGRAVGLVRADALLAGATRQNIQKMLANYQELRKLVRTPRGRNAESYLGTLKKITRNHAYYLKQLSTELVVPETE
jgi:S1-C subfamily serine protease